MDSANNPYTPGAGTPPPALTGREREIEEFTTLITRLSQNRPTQSMILHGLRGVGKTVLLAALEALADEKGWITVNREIRTDTNLRSVIGRISAKTVVELQHRSAATGLVERLGQMLQLFSVSASSEGVVTVGLSADRSEPVLTGNLEDDLVDLFLELGETAESAGTGIAFLLDELQLLPIPDLEALIAAIHRSGQKALPVALVGAGLPTLPALIGSAKSYAERLFSYRKLGPLQDDAARDALVLPAQEQSVSYEQKALQMILERADNYPYFLQEWGRATWANATQSPIKVSDVTNAEADVLEDLDSGFYNVRISRATKAELRYLLAMSQLGDGPYKTPAIASELDSSLASTSSVRKSLIAKGLIYVSERGAVDFTVPKFNDYLRRHRHDL